MDILIVKANRYEEVELLDFFQTNKCQVFFASEKQAIYQTLEQNSIDAVLYCLSCIDDFSKIRFINKNYPSVKVIISGESTLCNSIENVRQGIYSSLRSPFCLNQLNELFFEGESNPCQRALKSRSLLQHNKNEK